MDGMVEWITYNSQAEIDEALENNEVYAAFVVPEDFTVTSVGAQQGAGEVNPIVLTVNQGKNPMISSQLATAFNGVTSGDLPIVQQIYRPIPESLGMSAMFLPMLFVLMMFMSSVLTGITTMTTFPLKTEGRWKTLGAQAGIAVLGARRQSDRADCHVDRQQCHRRGVVEHGHAWDRRHPPRWAGSPRDERTHPARSQGLGP